MELLLIIGLGFLAVGLGVGFAVVLRRLSQLEELRRSDQGTVLLNQNLQGLQERLDRGLAQTNATVQASSNQSQQLVREVTTKLGQLEATNKRVQDFAGQLQSLENVLRNPKHRGVLGEYFLQTMLQEVLQPGSFSLQYRFANGEIVDAVVRVGETIVPIDAKFTLEHYNRMLAATDNSQREALEKQFKTDLKARIDETAKYVRPHEQTTPFAFMYIPAEGIYASLLATDVGSTAVNTRDLLRYAFEKRVLIVGPVSFFAYLQSALLGINAYQIQKDIQPILDRVRQLGVHIGQYDGHMERLGKQIGTTVTTYNTAYRELSKIDKDVVKLTGEKRDLLETIKIAGPDQSEAALDETTK
ncbi:DNA recombination protein RmuC [Candidatus Berkelbacteria bacterium]|nr:DNA recombination protein RmuC [Candidatus Berkelbacteria bacterium]